MIWPIQSVNQDEFVVLLQRLNWRRQISSIHLHQTWRPDHAQWRGQASIEAMRRVHMQERGFSDIAQHLTIDPYGGLWTGRDWNQPPASAKGENGDPAAGPFMIVLAGDFDDGRDRLAGAQADALDRVVGLLLGRFGLETASDSVISQIHRIGGKGNSLTAAVAGGGNPRLNKLLADRLEASRSADANPAAVSASTPPSLITLLAPPDPCAPAAGPVSDHEIPTDTSAQVSVARESRTLAGIDTSGSRGAINRRYADLYGHVINTSRGLLLESPEQAGKAGQFYTSQNELDSSLFRKLIEHEGALPDGEPLRLMFHAHGGLVDERSALEYARSHWRWWREGQNVYPFFMVWESGLLESIFQHKRELDSERGLFSWLSQGSDWVIEKTTGPIGRRVWSRMKANAELCSSADWHRSNRALGGGTPPRWAPSGVAGGARSFVRGLLAQLESLPVQRAVEFHAVGHSAGAIYHAHFVPMLLEELQLRGARLRDAKVKSLQLLAPALRIDAFEQRLVPALTRGIDAMTVYTMDDQREQEDSVTLAYRKSLLFLVNNAFEADDMPGLLGLQRSLDARIRHAGSASARAFAAGGPAQVLYSDGQQSNPYTQARKHGDFDNDPTTMTSVARTVIGAPLPPGANYRAWISDASRAQASARHPGLFDDDLAEDDPAPSRGPRPRPASGQRLALCIGIDDYPAGSALAGCVNDARQWAQALSSLDFTVNLLLDAEASRAGLIARIRSLLDRTGSGDWVVLQFAGHGTQFEDHSGDEISGFDQAYVPHDYRDSACLIDDEIYALLQPAASRGVHLSLFFDTCHSGSASRFAPLEGLPRGHHRRARFLPADAAMYARQQQVSGLRALRRARNETDAAVNWVHLAACRDEEYAYETDGSGDFTRVAVPLLSRARDEGWNGARLLQEVRRAFPPGSRQTPTLMPATNPNRVVLPGGAAGVGGQDAAFAELVGALEQALQAAHRLAGR